MHEFAEEYVANLVARDERYDTRLGDDFFVGTFPNGIKTWIYVYDVNGFTRRQTLGVYPEMPLARALESLYAARRTRQVESELAEQGMDGSQVRSTEDSPVNLDTRGSSGRTRFEWFDGRFLAGAGAGSVVTAVAAAAMVLYLFPPPQPLPANSGTRTGSGPDTPAAQTVLSVTDTSGAAMTADDGAIADPVQDNVEATVVAGADIAEGDPVDSEAADSAPPALTVELSQSQRAVRDLQRDMSGTLAWAQLTSAVRQGEPVDDLGWIVELGHEPRKIFYFVRVRGMAGGDVVYRWRHEGELVKEDTVRVGEGWHSPAVSSVTLTAARVGQWQVEVLASDARSLGLEQFETRLVAAPVLSRR